MVSNHFIDVLHRNILHCLGISIINKERHLRIFMEKFCGTPENHEKCESLAQRIFPRLQ